MEDYKTPVLPGGPGCQSVRIVRHGVRLDYNIAEKAWYKSIDLYFFSSQRLGIS